MRHPDDDLLEPLLGTSLPSETLPGTAFSITGRAGTGALFASFDAIRTAPEGDCPVVVKVLRPSFSRELGPAASVVVRKEAVSLGRLNERVPPTPFVVRLIDTGEVAIGQGRHALSLPWIAIEHVHGGPEGTTLRERVRRTLEATGHAFDPARALRAIEHIASGLSAVHEVGVIHRDLTPDAILCAGSAEDEILKISDFGLARPRGVDETLGISFLGTEELRAPELVLESGEIGPWTDVFGFARVIYFLLTGEELVAVRAEDDLIARLTSRARRSVLDAPGLHPALRAHESVCRSVDFALRWATAPDPDERLAEAESLAAMLVPYLRPTTAPSVVELEAEVEPPLWQMGALSTRRPGRRVGGSFEARVIVGESGTGARWAWTPLRHPGAGFTIRSLAWDGHGRCLAATGEGLLFFNGVDWRAMDSSGLPQPHGVRFVHKVGPGRWLVGGDASMLAAYTTGGLAGVFQRPAPPERYVGLSGDMDDMGVLAALPDEGPALLRAFVGRRWLRPCAVGGVAHIADLTRVEDDRWLLAVGAGDKGALLLYAPLDWQHERLPAPEVRAFTACAGAPESGLGVAVGTGGAVVWWSERRAVAECVDPRFDLSAVALGADGAAWAASSGRIWRRRPAPYGAGEWERVWSDDAWRAPVISLFVDFDAVMAVTVDGGILEGRFVA